MLPGRHALGVSSSAQCESEPPTTGYNRYSVTSCRLDSGTAQWCREKGGAGGIDGADGTR